MKSLYLGLAYAFLALLSSPLLAGGFVVVQPEQTRQPGQVSPGRRDPAFFPLEHRRLQVETQIVGQVATTSIDQVFYNPGERQLEGYFLFPVPKDVIINKFTMFINGKETSGELLDATKARQIYEDIVRRSLDPALLEFYEQGLFRVRIFPILPKSEQRIRLTYTETLVKDNGITAYSFPLNTQKYGAKPLEDFSIRIKMEHPQPFKTIYCPSHSLEINRKGEHQAMAGMEAKTLSGDRDLQLYFSTSTDRLSQVVLSHIAPDEKQGYFMLGISPGLSQQAEIVEKDVVFVLDKSGSMNEAKMKQAKAALAFCIEQLNPKDRFELIPFSTEAESFFGGVKQANAQNKQRAKSFLEGIRAIGGTNIDEALELASAAQTEDKDRPFMIIFLTDGKPTIGETNEDALLSKLNGKNKSEVRIFTFGIGSDLNTRLLDRLTEQTRGYRSYVADEEDIEVKVSNFYRNLSHPVLTNVRLEFDKAQVHISELYPKALPDLFLGSDLNILGRFSGKGETEFKLHGLINGKPQVLSFKVNLAEQAKARHNFLPHLWATRCVGHLLDQIRLKGEEPELVTEVVRLAKKHGIITPYTSYLILEDEALVPSPRPQPIRPPRPQPGPRPIPRERVLAPRAQAAPSSAVSWESQMAEDVAVQRDAKRHNSGKGSVRASQENQRMAKAEDLGQSQQGKKRLEFKDQKGQTQNLGDDIRLVQGRAFYLNENRWVDGNLALEEFEPQKERRIQFASAEYFKLLKEEKHREILSLGQNLRFLAGEEVIEIYL